MHWKNALFLRRATFVLRLFQRIFWSCLEPRATGFKGSKKINKNFGLECKRRCKDGSFRKQFCQHLFVLKSQRQIRYNRNFDQQRKGNVAFQRGKNVLSRELIRRLALFLEALSRLHPSSNIKNMNNIISDYKQEPEADNDNALVEMRYKTSAVFLNIRFGYYRIQSSKRAVKSKWR